MSIFSPFSPFTLVLTGLFALVTLTHGFSLRHVIKWSFRLHLRVMGLLWLLVVIGALTLTILIPDRQPPTIFSRMLGYLLVIGGLTLSVWHMRVLGWQQIMGGRFFESSYNHTWTTKGLYRYLKNPIYDGFLLIFVSLFFLKSQLDYLLLAVSSSLLLNIFLARIENKQLGPPPK